MEHGTTALAPRGMDLGQPVIDTDIHCNVPNVRALFPYLSEHWREYITYSAFKGPVDTAYPRGAATSSLPGTSGPDGEAPGTSLKLVREQVLDPWNVELGILNCTYAVESLHNPDTAAAMASAVNDWMIAEWLAEEPRLRASMVAPSRVPEMAAQEIDRIGSHPGIVQVFLPVVSEAPYGHRRYWPIFEAAQRHDLTVSLQFGGAPGNPPTGAGWPSYYLEDYAGMAQVFQTQILNLVVEGVFDHFPRLRIAMIEGGWTWIPSLMWRIDKDWKGLRREVPWNTMPPSDYIRGRMRFSLQPLDAAPDPKHMLQLIEQIGSDDVLMFSTDYPHWHFDRPEEAVPAGLPAELRRKILSENARSFYRFDK
ncbi:MAG: amidohydrolase [Chloroflexi bacterium]|nr:amidohydrolase [Chloroflexota bacterium]